jgi:hypothetical protein
VISLEKKIRIAIQTSGGFKFAYEKTVSKDPKTEPLKLNKAEPLKLKQIFPEKKKKVDAYV